MVSTELQERLESEQRAQQVLQALLDRLVLSGLLDCQAQQALLGLREQRALLGPQDYPGQQELQDRQVLVARQALQDLLVRLEQLA